MSSFRADRFATLQIFHRLARLKEHASRIPILMYHSISDVDDSNRHPYYRTVTTVAMFEQQIRFLHQNGYRVVSLPEAYKHTQDGKADEKLVSITFDDGFRDFYTRAFPVLSRYGYSATMFLPTAYIGEASREFKGSECLSWGEVRELRKAGVEFGSHTVTHPQLRSVSVDQMRDEVGRSKDEIEQKIGERIETFAYPFAFPETDAAFVETLREALQESKYQIGVTTIIGRSESSDGRFFMRRLPVNSDDDSRFFQAKLEGGYDWLRAIQYVAKLKTRRAAVAKKH